MLPPKWGREGAAGIGRSLEFDSGPTTTEVVICSKFSFFRLGLFNLQNKGENNSRRLSGLGVIISAECFVCRAWKQLLTGDSLRTGPCSGRMSLSLVKKESLRYFQDSKRKIQLSV